MKNKILFALVVGLLLQTIFATAQDGSPDTLDVSAFQVIEKSVLGGDYRLVFFPEEKQYSFLDKYNASFLNGRFESVKSIDSSHYLLGFPVFIYDSLHREYITQNRYLILDNSLKTTTLPDHYLQVDVIPNLKGYLCIHTNQTTSCIHHTGRVLIPPHPQVQYLRKGNFLIKEKEQYKIIDSTQKLIKELHTPYASANKNGTIECVSKDYKRGLLNERGDTLFPPIAIWATGISKDYAWVQDKKKVYIFNENDEYFSVKGTENAVVLENEILEYKDSTGCYFIDFRNRNYHSKAYEYLTFISDTVAIVRKNKLYGLINRKEEILLPIEYDNIWFSGVYGLVQPTFHNKLGVVSNHILPPNYLRGVPPVYPEPNISDEYGGILHPIYSNCRGGDDVSCVSFRADDAYLLVQKKGWHLVDIDGKMIRWDLDSLDMPSERDYYYGFYIFQDNQKYGFFDLQNGVYHAPIYDEIKRMNKTAIRIKKGDKYAVIIPNYDSNFVGYYPQVRKKNQKLDFKYNDVQPIPYTSAVKVKKESGWRISNYDYEDTLVDADDIISSNGRGALIVKIGDKYSIMSSVVNNKSNRMFDSLELLREKNYPYQTEFCLIGKDSLGWRFINEYGKCDETNIYLTKPTLEEAGILVKKGENYGLMAKDGSFILPFEYQSIEKGFPDLIVQKNGKYGCISYKQEPILPFEYQHLFQRWDKTFIAKKEGYFGVTNYKNDVVIPFVYDSIVNSFSGNFKAQKAGKWGYIDPKNQAVLPFLYEDIGATLTIHYTFKQKAITKLQNPKDYARLTTDSIYYAVKKRNYWGLISPNGKKRIDFKYDSIYCFSDYGLIGVKKNGKWGIITHQGISVIPIDYNEIIHIGWDGLILLKKNNKIGAVDWNHQIIVPFLHDRWSIKHFRPSGSVYSFYKGKKAFIYNTKGELLEKEN